MLTISCKESERCVLAIILVITLLILAYGLFCLCYSSFIIAAAWLLFFVPVAKANRNYIIDGDLISFKSRFTKAHVKWRISEIVPLSDKSPLLINGKRVSWIMPKGKAHKVFVRAVNRSMLTAPNTISHENKHKIWTPEEPF